MKSTNNQSFNNQLALLARRYTLPAKCPITHEDLIQEAHLALLEAKVMSLPGEWDLLQAEEYSIARKAMQRAIARYVSPVTRSLDTVLHQDDDGHPVTLADTLLAPDEPNLSERQTRDVLLDTAIAFLDTLDTQLAAGSITPTNYRKKKQRFLHKFRRQVSQNPDFSVYI